VGAAAGGGGSDDSDDQRGASDNRGASPAAAPAAGGSASDGGGSSSDGGGPGEHGRACGSSARGWRPLRVRAPSKFEAERLAAAKARHRECMRHEAAAAAERGDSASRRPPTLEQGPANELGCVAGNGDTLGSAAAGPSSKSAAEATPCFAACPPEVVFEDIEAGAPRRAEVVLVNRGAAKASIRLLDVPGEVGAV
jgi:hypothetical protein